MTREDNENLLAHIHELEGQLENYRRVNRVMRSIYRENRVEDVLQRLVEEALNLCHADEGVIMLLSPQNQLEGKTVVREGSPESQVLDHFLNTTLIGWVSRHKTLLRTDDLSAIFGEPVTVERYREICSVLSVPLLSGDTVIGVVNLISTNPERCFGKQEEHLVTIFAEQCVDLLHNARLREHLYEEARRLRKEVEQRYARHGLIGKSPAMQKVFTLLDKIIPTDARILLEGESGTGKERIARAIHYSGPRRDNPFVAVDCGALPANLLESELFGYVKGAFTGAIRDHKGLFEEADGGTLFLDEIVNMAPDIQAKFLRVIQEGEIRPLGTTATRRVDVRIIAAASENLRDKVTEGKFREDLYFRLNVVSIRIPPLRDRQEDIVLLANHFLKLMNERYGKQISGFTPETLDLLESHPWVGNVRELEHLVERLVVLADQNLQKITPEYLPGEFQSQAKKDGNEPVQNRSGLDIKQKKAALEKELLLSALKKHHWNQSAAARELGITEKAVRYKMQKLGVKKANS